MPTDSTVSAAEVVLRPADAADLPAVAELHLRAREAAYPAMPRGVHSSDKVRGWVGSWDLEAREVWLAETAGAVVGYAMTHDAWLDDLYVDPALQGAGIGTSLLDLVKVRRPGGFSLWVFESNVPAREFYTRRGLVALERTDGSANEEGAPDLRMAWPGSEPLAFFRDLIDDVDAQLGDLLARRAALTAAVQPHKTSTGRDPVRERAVAEALARRAPALGAERLARIVDVIVGESLDAADPG